MKTSPHTRLACVVALSILFAAPAVCVAASHPLRANASAQTSNRRPRKKTTRGRRARRRVANTVTAVAPTPSEGVEVKSGDTEGSAAVSPPPDIETPPGYAPKKTIVAGGVLNGKAIYKPQPTYPPVAKAARASGLVAVQIVVDESGQVIQAEAISGHPLLRQACVDAAMQSRFSPTRLSGQPVKVSGVITYNFVLQ